MIEKKGVRIDGRRVTKPGAQIKVGDILTFVQSARVRVVEVRSLSERRGPASEAQTLYFDRETDAG